MQTTIRDRAGIKMLHLNGRLMGGPETEQFKTTLKELIDANHSRFLIDLGGVDWLNSSGLGALICSYVRVTRSGGLIAFTGTDKVQQLIEMTCLHEVLDVYESTEDAVAYLLSEDFQPPAH